MRPILSVRDLAARLGTSSEELRAIASDVQAHYRSWTLFDPKKMKSRMLTIPTPKLRELQSRIRKNILAKFELPAEVHGGVRGRSPKTNAAQHLGQPCVVNIDVAKFYPHIRHYVVYRLFRGELGFGRDVARLLTRLTTFDGQVPQGAPTSTAIANILLMEPVDKPISREARAHQVQYSRFVDDITLSGRDPRPLINSVAKRLSKRRLPISIPKLKILKQSQPQEVTGLLVNAKGRVSLSKRRRDQVRAAISQLRNLADGEKKQKAINSIRGRIAYVRQTNPGTADRLRRSLEAALAKSNSA